MLKIIQILIIFPFLWIPAYATSSAAENAQPQDRAALAGLTTGKAIFDIRTNEPGRLLFTLKVIDETAAGLDAQGVKPEFVLSFRGGTVPLLKATPATANDAELAMLTEVRERLAEYQKRGMVLEVCNVAAKMFKIAEQDLDNHVTLVGNSLVSLIGYQNKGYALVPMY